jgi:hypothetical protein
VSKFYHQHKGGNHSHVHRSDDVDGAHHHHHATDRDLENHPNEHGLHVYDAQGHEPAVVLGEPGELGHWHFDVRFEHIAFAVSLNISLASARLRIPFINRSCVVVHLKARPPPTPT